MEQVQLYIAGERDYTKIQGGTGPLVYPAAHVYIYRALYAVTEQGRDIRLAQIIFGTVYLGTLAVVMGCYRLAEVPPYVLPLLVLSKRLHSVYLLRLFNDCFAVAGLFLAIFAYQKRKWWLGSIIYSLALGVKMSVLLTAPAVAVILYQGYILESFWARSVELAVSTLGVQVLIALPFLRTNPLGYLSRAFELTRVFLFKWTVNWRFVGEDLFLSKSFSVSLLLAHATLLALFLATRWLRPTGRSLPDAIIMAFRPPSPQTAQAISHRVTPTFILTTSLTANVIGMLCARSLHYQFYSWLAWGMPFLLWRAGFHPIIQYALWAAQEWAWNVFPSTDTSSKVVVGVLAITVVGLWTNTRRDSTSGLKKRKRDPNNGTRRQHVD
ncbi:MAG: hypothetical protein M4579_001272 [Chaenotheca gracillima]|nr:MAG: hypothetical protein M4579_001272 [Chaenotheca gracillima]